MLPALLSMCVLTALNLPPVEEELAWLEQWRDEINEYNKLGANKCGWVRNVDAPESTQKISPQELEEAHAELLRRVLDRPYKQKHDWEVLTKTLMNIYFIPIVDSSVLPMAREVLYLPVGNELSSREMSAFSAALNVLGNHQNVAVHATTEFFWRHITATGFEDPEEFFGGVCDNPVSNLRTSAASKLAHRADPELAIPALSRLRESLPDGNCKLYVAQLLEVARQRIAGTYERPIP